MPRELSKMKTTFYIVTLLALTLTACNLPKKCSADTDCASADQSCSNGFCVVNRPSPTDAGIDGGVPPVVDAGQCTADKCASKGVGFACDTTSPVGECVNVLSTLSFVTPKAAEVFGGPEGGAKSKVPLLVGYNLAPNIIFPNYPSKVTVSAPGVSPVELTLGARNDQGVSNGFGGELVLPATVMSSMLELTATDDQPAPKTATVTIDVDRTGPALTSAKWVGEKAGQDVKRDESAYVLVESNEAATVDLKAPTGVVAKPLGALTECTNRTLACTTPARCACFEISVAADLAFEGLTKKYEFTVDLTDSAGNKTMAIAAAGATFTATRLRWQLGLTDSIEPLSNKFFPPAVDSNGNVYLGTQVTLTKGALYKVKPDGTLDLSFDTDGKIDNLGAVTSGPVVSKNFVYWATKDNAGVAIRRVSKSGGVPDIACNSGTSTIASTLSLGNLDMTPETVFGARLDGFLVATKFGDPIANCAGPKLNSQPWSGVMTTMVEQGGLSTTVYASTDQQRSLTFVNFPTGSSTGTAVTSDAVTGNSNRIKSLFPLGAGKIAAATTDGLFTFIGPALNADPMSRISAGSASFNFGVVGAGGSVFLGEASDQKVLLRSSFANDKFSMSVASAATADALVTSPVLGASGEVYVAGNGNIYTFRGNSGATAPLLRWTASIGGGPLELNLDVARKADGSKNCDSGFGTLYATSTETQSLYAVIVDSKGIQSPSVWPKFQHDPGNTGNAAGDLLEYSCQ